MVLQEALKGQKWSITRSTKGPEMDSVATILPVAELTRRIKATMEKAGMA